MNNWKNKGRKVLKALAWVAGIYILLLSAASWYINSKKKEILEIISAQAREKLGDNAVVGDVEVSVWKYFPSIGFSVKNFTLVDSVYKKPLLSAGSVTTTLSIPGLLSAHKKIQNIHLADGLFHLFTDNSNYSNKYLLQLKPGSKPAKDTNTKVTVDINEVTISNFSVAIEDKTANKEISMLLNEVEIGIDKKDNIIDLLLNEDVTMKKGLAFNLAKGAYLEGQTLAGKWKLKFDKTEKSLSFDKTRVDINNHRFVLNGKFVFDETYPSFILLIDTKNLPYENANRILTAAIRQKTELVQLKNPIDVHGSVAGSLLPNNEPAVNINWQTKNNTLTTSVVSFTDCSFTGNFTNSVNKDSLHSDPNSRISFSSFKGNWDGVNLSGKDINITNLLDPELHFVLQSNCKLQALDNKFALKDIAFKGGAANLKLFYDGPLTSDTTLLLGLQGQLNIKDGLIEYIPRNFVFTNCNGDVGFFKDSISIRKFSCRYMQNKLDAEVEGTNIRRRLLNNDVSQEAVVKCFVRSPYLNLNDFDPLFAPVKQRAVEIKPPPTFAATAKMLDDLLVNSVIDVHLKANEIRHDSLQAKNFEANIKFLPHQWEVAKVSVNLAGGNIFTTGKIIHGGNGNHDADITAQVTNVDVSKLLYAFDNFRQDAITGRHITGSFSTTASLKAGIDAMGNFIPSSMFGTVDFSLKNGSLQNFPPFESMKRYVFKNRNMTDVKFAELKNKIEINGTDVFINRMGIESSVCRMFVQGNYDFKGENTDMLVQVPFSNLNDDSFMDGKTPQKNTGSENQGMSFWLRAENDKNGKVKIKLTFNNKLREEKNNLKLQKSLETSKVN